MIIKFLENILTKGFIRVKHLLKAGVGLAGVLLLLAGCLPPVPPEAGQPPAPGVVVPPEEHQGRAREFALENREQLVLLGRAARKRSQQLVFDRRGIRFEEQKNEVVLVIRGRYFEKFDPDKTTSEGEARELWRTVVGPLLEEIFIKERSAVEQKVSAGPFKLGFDRVTVTLRYERESSSHPGFTQEVESIFDTQAYKPQEGPRPQRVQSFLYRTKVKIEGKDTVLRE